MTGLRNNPLSPAQARGRIAEAIAQYAARALVRQMEHDLSAWLEHSGLPADSREELTLPEDWLRLFSERLPLLSAVESPRRAEDEDGVADYLGNCPICGSGGMARDVGHWLWIACDEHRLCWEVGNMTGMLRDRFPDLDADELYQAYAKNRASLKGYRVIDAVSEARYPRSPADVRAFVKRLQDGTVMACHPEGPRTDTGAGRMDDEASKRGNIFSQEAYYTQLGLVTGDESDSQLAERLGLTTVNLERFLAGEDEMGRQILRTSAGRVIVLKLNTEVRPNPCAICGAAANPRGGLDYVLEWTRALVCDACAEYHAPGLRMLVGRGWHAADPVTQFVTVDHELTEADVIRLVAQLST